MTPGATYKVTHPYGVETLEADEDGRVFATEDIGALTLPADHSMTLKSRIFDEFLQWDPAESAPPLAISVIRIRSTR